MKVQVYLHERGPALVPELKPLEWLLTQRAEDAQAFAALYQQDPLAAGGGLFPRAAFQLDRRAPGLSQPQILVDASFKEGITSDFSVVMLMAKGKADGHAYVIDVWREQCDVTTLWRAIHAMHAKAQGLGLKESIWVEERANGHATISTLTKKHALVGPDGQAVSKDPLPVKAWKPKGGWGTSKAARWEGVAPWQQAGMVHLVEGPWVEDFLAELERIPASKNDDQADALAMGLELYFSGPAPVKDAPTVKLRDADDKPAKDGALEATVKALTAPGEDAIIQSLRDQGIPY